MSEENVAVVRRALEAFNRRDMAGMLAELDPECEWVEDPRYPGAETFHGRAGAERSIRKWWDAWEITLDPEEFIDLGDHVVVAGHSRARGHGSEVALTASFGSVFEFRDGKVVRSQAFGSRDEALAAVEGS